MVFHQITISSFFNLNMITERSKVLILLTSRLPNDKSGAKPLTTNEYNRLATWLDKKNVLLEDLTGNDCEDILVDWSGDKITKRRLTALLDRVSTLTTSMDKWEQDGVWVINQSEEEYPSQLKKVLAHRSPPLLYGIGNKKILQTKAIGVVGSRNASDDILSYTHSLGKRVVEEGYSVVSGGARGVDEHAMLGALESGGTCIGILADGLLKKSKSDTYQKYIKENNLVLLSTCHPEARFFVGNATARNRYIYITSEATFVVHSGVKGGTWSGAVENLKKQWVPTYVKENNDPASGNAALLAKGDFTLSMR